LRAELDQLDRQIVEAAATEGGPERPRRLAGKSEAEAIARQADLVREQMLEHTVRLLIAGQQTTVWRAWCLEHPARENNPVDARITFGICNADDLVARLGDFVDAINDAAPAAGDWDFLAASAAPGDLFGMARVIVEMHEVGVDLGKSRTAWLANLRTDSDSE
jgi:hypothetical protein